MHGARRWVGVGVVAGIVGGLGCHSGPSESPVATPTALLATATRTAVATAVASPTITAPPPRSPVPSPVAIRTLAAAEAMPPPEAPVGTASGSQRAAGAAAAPAQEGVAPPYAAIPTAQPPAARQPRAFRTPERAGDQAFIPPQGGAGADDAGDTGTAANGAAAPNAAGSRATSGVVILRATARTVVEGFDARVTYPQSLGRFTATNNQADCTGAAGAIVTASDRGTGELRVLVASAQALPFPFDVFCRFTVAAGARLEPRAFEARVAEVSSDGKKADPGLVVVDVVVR